MDRKLCITPPTNNDHTMTLRPVSLNRVCRTCTPDRPKAIEIYQEERSASVRHLKRSL